MASSQLGRPRTPPSLVREIAASDDEGSDGSSSDDSLQDLTALLGGHGPSPAPPTAANHQLQPTTPQRRSKRPAAGSSRPGHRSPLVNIPRHRFDLAALAKDARRDTALQASSQLARVPVRTATPSMPGGSGNGSDLTGLVSSASKPGDAHKVLRAVQRADPGHQELRYCFFRPSLDEPDCPPPRRPPPPPEARRIPWTLLTEGNPRVCEQNLVSGVPFSVVERRGAMPPSVFLWLLEEICAPGASPVTRAELCHLIAACPEQVAALLTPKLLKSIWERIGAADASLQRGRINVAKVSDEVYKGRDWAPLLAILSLLSDTASALPLETRTYMLQLLLRMAMDMVVLTNIDIDDQFEHTFKNLIETIPPRDWDGFCHDTCALLLSNFSSPCIRVSALLCLPTSSSRAHDLRRRLAATFLFRDASLARRAPEAAITLQAIIDRLGERDFDVSPGTEFAELRAAVLILDMAVDDGSVLAGPADHAEEDRFNERVDELAARLGDIWRRINDAGMKLARTEAKSVVEWVQKRVTHTVRTRRRPPTSIFDLPGHQEQQQRQRRDLPRQQEFMKSFFRKKMPSPKPAPKPGSESEPEEVLDCIEVKLE
ncbi:hypothetical protein ISF_01260 [Cordyceps fumosorosea ARSEF 2679]|uniref:Uncharacterized protein n=1 Tax=Cordyceps fumosorosea (strain ARSEF 2679) TaxID=1081104 RepID=A0A168D5D0_CORFA|nr:hypothetical protein ISF_01260 [Cordyceps fumosorosea ARSEF 2679]OAA72187.1 hypothetical protein ISF_01260 [Cordyceps fumosorosea ARSEF 2679]